MHQRDDVLRLLAARPDGMTDAEIARGLRCAHPAANQLCRELAGEGVIVRLDADRPILNRLIDGVVPAPRRHREPVQRGAWYEQVRVRAAVERHLAERGARIRSVVDTGARVIAELGGRRVHVAVAGWPRRADTAPDPAVAARHRYAVALLEAMRLRQRFAEDRVAIALPALQRYRCLAADTAQALCSTAVEVWIVDATGGVTGG